jgi:hypothetical protein
MLHDPRADRRRALATHGPGDAHPPATIPIQENAPMQLDLDTLAVQSFSTSADREAGLPTPETENTGPGGQYTLCFICPGSAYCNTGVNVC